MDDFPRTFDKELREGRRAYLTAAASRAEEALSDDSGYRLMVTGSLSRGQVHPWSDLDLVLVLRDGMDAAMDNEARSDLRRRIIDAVDMYEADIVFDDEVVEGLRKGMLGSLVEVADIPALADLPDVSVALARIHVSMHYALEASESIMADYRKSEDELRRILSDYDRLSSSHAMDPLRRKAFLWMKKLAVFADGGRSPWLDDSDDDEALDRLLARLSSPCSSTDGAKSLLSQSATAALRWLLVDAYDFTFAQGDEGSPPMDTYVEIRDAISDLRREMEAMVPGVPTHGIDGSGFSFSP